MRFIIYGAGGVGGVVGGRLAQHGHDVVLIARGAHLDVLQRDGLRLQDPDGTEVLPVPAVGAPAAVDWQPDDVVLLGMKSQHTEAALIELAATAPADLPVLCLQNGVENERRALRLFPRTYGVCVMLPAAHLEPGLVQAYSAPVSGNLDLGTFPIGPADDTAREVAEALSASTFSSYAVDDIMRWKHTKLLMNLGNVIEAAVGPAARTSTIAGQARDEGEAVLRGAGIEFASWEEDAERRGDLVRMRRIDGELREGGSTWQSLARGAPSIETDDLNGEIVLQARLAAIDAPVNAMLQRLGHELIATGAAPGSMTEDDLLARL